MNKSETELLLRYAMRLYPNCRWNEQQFNSAVALWHNEFSNEPRELIACAFTNATYSSPEWMPTIPMVRSAIRFLESRVKEKSKEEEFRDKHCGKSELEWKSLNKWNDSEAGNSKIKDTLKSIRNLLTEDKTG